MRKNFGLTKEERSLFVVNKNMKGNKGNCVYSSNLENSENIKKHHISEVIQYRSLDRKY